MTSYAPSISCRGPSSQDFTKCFTIVDAMPATLEQRAFGRDERSDVDVIIPDSLDSGAYVFKVLCCT